MPLSFATILGGVITTIGTSTTLVVSGPGRPVRARGASRSSRSCRSACRWRWSAGCCWCCSRPACCPTGARRFAQVASHERDYTFRLQVQPGGPLDGPTVADGGLRNLEKVYLAALQRGELELTPLSAGHACCRPTTC